MAPPKPRSKRYRDLPDNLEPDPQNRNGKPVVYFRYVFPDGRRKSLGKDREHAKAVAKALNQELARDTVKDAVAAMLGNHTRDNPPLNKVIEEFEAHYLPGKQYSARSLDEISIKLKRYRETWGNQVVQSFTTLQAAEFLNKLSVSAYIKHRKLLLDLFAFAGHQGYVNANPVAITLAKSDSQRQKKRQRHTIEGYRAIYDAAPEWLQRAMDIALRTLQRRGDLCSLHRDQVDMERGTIRILQEKTRQYKEPVYLEIQMGKELRSAVQACLGTGIPCPYLIHYRPERMKASNRAAKLHPFAVTESHLTKTFAKVRDESGAYDHLDKDQRPSFHDIRALGIWLYEKAGFPPEYINALSGHASNAMREHYAEGHEAKAPKLVSADLSFPENTPKIPRK